MELFVLFLIAAVGGAWWLNHVMHKKAAESAQKKLEESEQAAPYKVPEPTTTTPTPLVVDAQLPTVQLEQVAAPVAEVAPAKKPRKPATKSSAVSKARTKRVAATKTASKKIKK